MEIKNLIDRLDDWDGVDTIYNGGFVEVNHRGVFRLLEEAAAALEQLQVENDRLRRERDAAEEDLNAIIGDIGEIRRGYGVDNYDADSAFADLCENYCANKSHRCYVEAEKYRCNNFKWRGPKEE